MLTVIRGLPEVVGETGEVVSQINSIDHWVEAIRSALANHDPEAQRQRVQRFSVDRQCEELQRIIEKLVT